MSITQTLQLHDTQAMTVNATCAPQPLRVLPPESPLRMQRQELLPSPVVLQRTFWRQLGDAVFSVLAFPVRLTRAAHTFFFARPEGGMAES